MTRFFTTSDWIPRSDSCRTAILHQLRRIFPCSSRKNEGEEYRNFLEDKVRKLGLQKHVKFYNKYLSLGEIVKYLKASDIYVSASLDPNQITSGTLSYALGCGRVVVSTPFLHAKDCITNDIGRLVEFKNSDSFSKAINEIFEDEENKKSIMDLSTYLKKHYKGKNLKDILKET